jgi:hypothetical protein
MAKMPVALQPYSVRGDCQKDLPATIAAVAKLYPGRAGTNSAHHGPCSESFCDARLS